MSEHTHTQLPQTQVAINDQISGGGSPRHKFLIPSPIPTRRTRTYSQSEKAKQGPVFKGTVKSFCRQKGHGFIIPEGEAAPVFVHISDIEGEFVPLEGDEVTYNLCKIPPKMEKEQAVHVKIDKLKPGETHYRWDSSPVTPPQ